MRVVSNGYSVESIKHQSGGSEYINVRGLSLEYNKLFVDLEVSEKVKKYFFKTRFTIEFDRNLGGAHESILLIPALSLIAPVAWATGANIIVKEIDETFLKSLQIIRKLFEEWYPQLRSQSKFKIGNIVNNILENKKSGLLFSGGLDSLASYLRNRASNPTLITLLKNDDRYRFYDKIQTSFQNFAEDEGVGIHFIRTDIWDARSSTINNKLLENDFYLHGWWEDVSHGLITLGICAPLTIVEGIGTLRLASTFAKDQMEKHGSDYLRETKLSWANIDIIYDSPDLNRQQKIGNILKGNELYYKYLRVCIDPSHYRVAESLPYPRNCGHCEKCLRTVTGLILEGIDPNKCNFIVASDVLARIREAFINGSLNIQSSHTLQFWQEFQSRIHAGGTNHNDAKVTKVYSANEFFEWFKNYDLKSYKPNTYNVLKSELYFSLGHGGLYPTVKQIIGYVSSRYRKRMRVNGTIQ